jgi:hypothetical protein
MGIGFGQLIDTPGSSRGLNPFLPKLLPFFVRTLPPIRTALQQTPLLCCAESADARAAGKRLGTSLPGRFCAARKTFTCMLRKAPQISFRDFISASPGLEGRFWDARPIPRLGDRLRWLDTANAHHGGPPLGSPLTPRDPCRILPETFSPRCPEAKTSPQLSSTLSLHLSGVRPYLKL